MSSDRTTERLAHAFPHLMPIPCGCGLHADGGLCYRCRLPLCDPCGQLGGGWCLDCCNAVALSSPANEHPA